jgi:hypothetical protein
LTADSKNMEKPDGTTSYQKGNEERGPIKKGI